VTETLEFRVLRQIGNVEIREYPTILIAMVRGLPDEYAFRILFNYITGNNKVHKEVAMTTPVISTGPTYERIAMTTPVISDRRSFSFVMPSEYSISTIPEPLDERVKILEIKGRRLAVLRFSGRSYDDAVKRRERELLEALLGNGVKVKGEPFLMRYNGPFTPGLLRRNEMAVEVES
jgi:DNA gyrase inhibitor GyrI